MAHFAGSSEWGQVFQNDKRSSEWGQVFQNDKTKNQYGNCIRVCVIYDLTYPEYLNGVRICANPANPEPSKVLKGRISKIRLKRKKETIDGNEYLDQKVYVTAGGSL